MDSFDKKVKFIYSEKVIKFCEIFTLLLTGTTLEKSQLKILQNFVVFLEYMNIILNLFDLLENLLLLEYKFDLALMLNIIGQIFYLLTENRHFNRSRTRK